MLYLLQEAITRLLVNSWRSICCPILVKQSSKWKSLRTVVRRNDGLTDRDLLRRLRSRPASPPRRLRHIRRSGSNRSPLINHSPLLRRRTRTTTKGKDVRKQNSEMTQKPLVRLPDFTADSPLPHSCPRLLGTTSADFGSRTPLTSQSLDSSRLTLHQVCKGSTIIGVRT